MKAKRYEYKYIVEHETDIFEQRMKFLGDEGYRCVHAGVTTDSAIDYCIHSAVMEREIEVAEA